MKSFSPMLVVSAVAFRESAEVSPISKVIQMLNGMAEQAKKAKHEEQVTFAAFKQFCDDTVASKGRAIKENTEKVEILHADIAKAVADSQQLTKDIAGHDSDIAVWTGDKKASTKVREIEKADYQALHDDYSESNAALSKAIAVLKRRAHDREQAELVQLKDLRLIPAQAKSAINLFLQQGGGDGLADAPSANAYEFQSGKIVDMLEKLQDKFAEEKMALEQEELNSRHAFEMLIQDLDAQIDAATTDRGEMAAMKAGKLQSKADAEGDLKDAQGTLDEDTKYTADLRATCETKAGDFEAHQEMRAAEITAIEKAMEIISGDSVAGAGERHLSSALVQRAALLAQRRADGRSPLQQRASDFLIGRGHSLHSKVLLTLATQVKTDPFTKVKKMIKDLIVRLMEEANEEAEHKGWCDSELSTNEQTRKEKTVAVEGLHAEIDELEASLTKLSEDVTELSKALSDLQTGIAEATQIRQVEKAKNAQASKDASDAQQAVATAIEVLRDFYAKSAESTALMQRDQNQHGKGSQKQHEMGGQANGVLEMLDVILSDFARLQARTDSAEASAQREYDEFMTDSHVDQAAKETSLKHKTAKRQDEEQALVTKRADIDGTQKELDAALSYYDKLKPSCVDSGMSFEDRVQRRKEEIESLQEALKILNGEDIA
jgi:hypothetical protein